MSETRNLEKIDLNTNESFPSVGSTDNPSDAMYVKQTSGNFVDLGVTDKNGKFLGLNTNTPIYRRDSSWEPPLPQAYVDFLGIDRVMVEVCPASCLENQKNYSDGVVYNGQSYFRDIPNWNGTDNEVYLITRVTSNNVIQDIITSKTTWRRNKGRGLIEWRGFTNLNPLNALDFKVNSLAVIKAVGRGDSNNLTEEDKDAFAEKLGLQRVQ